MKHAEIKKLLTGYGVEFNNLINRVEDEFTGMAESQLQDIEDYLNTLTTTNCYWAIWDLRSYLRFAVEIARRRQKEETAVPLAEK